MFGYNKKKQAVKEVEDKLNLVQMNIENNYKDLAIQARADAEELLKRYRIRGDYTQKEFDRLKDRLDSYTKRMEGYHH